ncbi:DUF2502 domain-containing protein [Scandinavium lactucae]|uniref:DUF2502 domain-containing protein n=1 Tax=Scandinavium lactucae TaxID=3095028 RepID=A0ABU4QJW7_9ENTR|nr:MULTISPECIES: DUF2502 domain-containing protein [unclassified Scandinavium]MDX6038772.1 DUF2502 domain-containing protein [Scandinavium sp. V105_6]MDX6049272.1 DUF2502 domain-containing protein [Scandinavium sp. V105_1]
MSNLKPVLLALSMMLVAPAAVHASEITLVPAVKLQIGDQDNRGHYWDGGNWRDHDWWDHHYERYNNHWRARDNHHDHHDDRHDNHHDNGNHYGQYKHH